MSSQQPANRHLYWSCPFFKWDGLTAVHCEGGKISFPDREAADQYMAGYCAAMPGWERCTVAAALYEFYDKQEDDNAEHRQDQGS